MDGGSELDERGDLEGRGESHVKRSRERGPGVPETWDREVPGIS